jgi:hypothetical protein
MTLARYPAGIMGEFTAEQRRATIWGSLAPKNVPAAELVSTVLVMAVRHA